VVASDYRARALIEETLVAEDVTATEHRADALLAPLPGVDAEARALARRAWVHLEALADVVYFAPEVHEAHRAVGLRGRTMGYVAGRIAPLGPVGGDVAVATFHGFSPSVLHRALPDAWSFASPPEVLRASQEGVAAALAPHLDGLDAEVRRAAELAREAAAFHPVVGRPLAAAWAGLPAPDDAALALWRSAMVVRESRGDGHLALLVAAGVEGLDAHLLLAGDSEKLRAALSPLRGWSDPEWDAGVARLRARGLLDDVGALTERGRALRTRLEERTDELAAPPWVALGTAATEELLGAVRPLLERIVATGILPRTVVRRLEV
jgi:hypothetical protein